MSRYAIYISGNTATCPECAGMMKHIGLTVDFRCNDCGRIYRCIGMYKSPRALIYETEEPNGYRGTDSIAVHSDSKHEEIGGRYGKINQMG